MSDASKAHFGDSVEEFMNSIKFEIIEQKAEPTEKKTETQ